MVGQGTEAYITPREGLFVLVIKKVAVGVTGPPPASELRVVGVINQLKNPKSVAIQFRYAFVTDDEGFKVVDITNPEAPKFVNAAFFPISNGQAHTVYVTRTYPYLPPSHQALP